MNVSGLIVFVACLAALMVGAGSIKTCALLGVKPLVLGLTVVAMGTSVPELAMGITASLQRSGIEALVLSFPIAAPHVAYVHRIY
ncbi:MAG: hypothetical protein LUO89_16115 [Methanothrix sp.]|nr:hypothetical protein [Methanothrix sp.]